MSHQERAKQKRIAERERMEALSKRVSKKNAIVVPKPPKEELKAITEIANANAERIGESSFKRFTAIRTK